MPDVRIRKALAVAAGLAVVATATPAIAAVADQSTPRVARVVGAAEFVLPYHPDDDVRRFEFRAQGAPFTRPVGDLPGLPNDAEGTVRISHYQASTGSTFTAEGAVDSMITSPRTATLTAIITEVSAGGPEHWKGKRLGFSVYDAGRDAAGRSADRVGLSWDIVNLNVTGSGELEESPIGTSMASAPFAPVTRGGYTVTHAELPQFPESGR